MSISVTYLYVFLNCVQQLLRLFFILLSLSFSIYPMQSSIHTQRHAHYSHMKKIIKILTAPADRHCCMMMQMYACACFHTKQTQIHTISYAFESVVVLKLIPISNVIIIHTYTTFIVSINIFKWCKIFMRIQNNEK